MLCIVLLVGMCAHEIQAGFKGRLNIVPLEAVTHKQTDGWLGHPDLFVRVRAYKTSNVSQSRMTEHVAVSVSSKATFSRILKFKGNGPWEKMEITIADKDMGEYGEGDDDILYGPEEVVFDKRRGSKLLGDANAAVVVLWSIKKS